MQSIRIELPVLAEDDADALLHLATTAPGTLAASVKGTTLHVILTRANHAHHLAHELDHRLHEDTPYAAFGRSGQ